MHNQPQLFAFFTNIIVFFSLLPAFSMQSKYFHNNLMLVFRVKRQFWHGGCQKYKGNFAMTVGQ